MNNIFISGFSFDLTNGSNLDDWHDVLDRLEEFLNEIKDYNKAQVAADCLEYRLGGDTLDDIIFEISNMNEQLSAEMLRDFNMVVSNFKSRIYTNTILNSSGAGPVYNGSFISLYIQNKLLPAVSGIIQVNSSDELDELNYYNLGHFPVNEASFSSRAQLIFDNISYHHNFESTLSTVVSGDFKLYSIEFARSLKILHDSFPKLTSKGHNPPDLDTIRCESGIAGRAMDCTVQGSNKALLCNKSFDIKLIDGKQHHIASLNCEYHLKINHDNNGKRLSKRFYNRAYFGLPLINGKKYIALYHLGKHY
ncbi:hypothetical protein CW613_001029 [Vibrio mimicus]